MKYTIYRSRWQTMIYLNPIVEMGYAHILVRRGSRYVTARYSAHYRDCGDLITNDWQTAKRFALTGREN